MILFDIFNWKRPRFQAARVHTPDGEGNFTSSSRDALSGRPSTSSPRRSEVVPSVLVRPDSYSQMKSCGTHTTTPTSDSANGVGAAKAGSQYTISNESPHIARDGTAAKRSVLVTTSIFDELGIDDITAHSDEGVVTSGDGLTARNRLALPTSLLYGLGVDSS